ncbi:hypothetical protein DPEC_G00272830 [Dallia pectoralis]|uniref:Uncharacterized protein n=1 Tax=Dallia pectoralis TaxID=75939 RepID=A0ACC2FQC3_DALPE|nr:hypothetical protein DPEC_G00272830 [Dallia pectoralis]
MRVRGAKHNSKYNKYNRSPNNYNRSSNKHNHRPSTDHTHYSLNYYPCTRHTTPTRHT